MPHEPSHEPTCDLRLDPEWIIPVEPTGRVLRHHSLLVKAGRIAALLPCRQADAWQATERIRLPDHALIPGLVNLHTHAAMTLLRGYADDLPLMVWLREHIWPAEGRWVSAEFVLDGSRLACLEMLRAGITCFNDMYFFAESTLEAAVTARQRVAAGLIVVDFPSAYAADPDGYLQKGIDLRDAWKNEPLASFCLAPHAPYSTADRTLEKVATYAAQLDLPIHMHVHETRDEIAQSIKDHGIRPLARLRNLGLLGPGFIAVHAVQLEAAEIDMLASHGCHVAHCPSSNLKLASGMAPIARLLAQGVHVGVGTDGPASNNRLDQWQEMRLTALLAKGSSGDPAAVPAHIALEMATLAGARALGLDGQIGSLGLGKQADLVAVDLSGVENQPCYDPISQLVYCAGRQHVRHVWVGGQAVVREGVCLTLDAAEVRQKAMVWRERLRPGG
ncbi:MAG TPA: TRZ/ATZ family hydrolase [Thiobacillaceae bacterium]|nr:TRZ/ATZ family hydrolase [Thiobacillaceae bacterium]HNU63187.1 TRZ/ATZ family hydrolase [Thiobacillaceae bacterium]